MLTEIEILRIARKAAGVVRPISTVMDYDDKVQEAALALCGPRPSWARAKGQIVDALRRTVPGLRRGRPLYFVSLDQMLECGDMEK